MLHSLFEINNRSQGFGCAVWLMTHETIDDMFEIVAVVLDRTNN